MFNAKTALLLPRVLSIKYSAFVPKEAQPKRLLRWINSRNTQTGVAADRSTKAGKMQMSDILYPNSPRLSRVKLKNLQSIIRSCKVNQCLQRQAERVSQRDPQPLGK